MSDIVDLFNDRYEGEPVEGTVAERKQVQVSWSFYLYQAYTRSLYGVLGRGVCIHHPPCIVEEIHTLAPNSMNKYKGHVDAIEP